MPNVRAVGPGARRNEARLATRDPVEWWDFDKIECPGQVCNHFGISMSHLFWQRDISQQQSQLSFGASTVTCINWHRALSLQTYGFWRDEWTHSSTYHCSWWHQFLSKQRRQNWGSSTVECACVLRTLSRSDLCAFYPFHTDVSGGAPARNGDHQDSHLQVFDLEPQPSHGCGRQLFFEAWARGSWGSLHLGETWRLWNSAWSSMPQCS